MTQAQSAPSASDRFLIASLQYALDERWVTYEDMSAAFPPSQIMSALESALELRTKLLVELLGVHEKIAPKKSTAAATEDLAIALAEGVVSPQKLFMTFGPEDQVKYLSQKELWDVLCATNFWTNDDARSRKRVQHGLELAEAEGLLTKKEIVAKLGAARLAGALPRDLLERAMTQAIQLGFEGRALTPEKLFQELSLAVWVEHIELKVLWTKLVSENIAVASGFTEAPAPEESFPLQSSVEVEQDAVIEVPATSAELEAPRDAEGSARLRAIASLEKMNRLPPHVDELSTSLLLGLDAMCAELSILTDDEERELCIREAFPNEALLGEALLALAESLDPRLDRARLGQAPVDIDALVQIVLFEERQRSRSSSLPASEPPSELDPPVSSSAAPPPLPSRSAPPPLPPLGTGVTRSPLPPLPKRSEH